MPECVVIMDSFESNIIALTCERDGVPSYTVSVC